MADVLTALCTWITGTPTLEASKDEDAEAGREDDSSHGGESISFSAGCVWRNTSTLMVQKSTGRVEISSIVLQQWAHKLAPPLCELNDHP